MILNHSRLKGPRRSRLAGVAGIRQGRVFMQSDAPTTVPIARCEGDLLNAQVAAVQEGAAGSATISSGVNRMLGAAVYADLAG